MEVTGFLYIEVQRYRVHRKVKKAKDAPWDAVLVGSVVRTVIAKIIRN
jgi:hypothetical protein